MNYSLKRWFFVDQMIYFWAFSQASISSFERLAARGCLWQTETNGWAKHCSCRGTSALEMEFPSWRLCYANSKSRVWIGHVWLTPFSSLLAWKPGALVPQSKFIYSFSGRQSCLRKRQHRLRNVKRGGELTCSSTKVTPANKKNQLPSFLLKICEFYNLRYNQTFAVNVFKRLLCMPRSTFTVWIPSYIFSRLVRCTRWTFDADKP